MHTIQKGDLSVAMITATFLRRGFVVLRPVSELSRYDLVIDRGNGFERIQCKTGRLRNGVVRFSTSSSLAHHRSGKTRITYDGQIEAFGVYCPDNDDVYVVPISVTGKAECVLRVESTKNGQASGVNFASAYRL